MIFILIASAALALSLVAAGCIVAIRSALSLYRSARLFEQRTEPLVAVTIHLAEVAQNRAITVAEKAEAVQRRIYLLSVALQPMKILVSTMQRTLEPVKRARDYVGL
ncbi:MAG: hypothetical protein ACYC5A_10410 [Thermoleophilia bacterium]